MDRDSQESQPFEKDKTGEKSRVHRSFADESQVGENNIETEGEESAAGRMEKELWLRDI
jgi:hypothetical protein